MEIENIPISEIKPYEKNPRKNEKAVEIVAKSIKEFGFKVPIILDKNNEIIAGHTRLKAAIKLGIKEIPIIRANELSDKQVKAFRIMDNKSAEYAEWNLELLKEELYSLEGSEVFELTGFSSEEISTIWDKDKEVIEDTIAVDAYERAKSKTKIKQGEIYELGDHRLMCGDSTKKEDVTLLMGENKADMVFTDPPYNVDYGKHNNPKYKQKNNTIMNDNLKNEDWKLFQKNWLERIKENISGAIYICMSAKSLPQLRVDFEECGFHWSSDIIWVKDRFVIGRKDYNSRYEGILYGWIEGEKHFWCQDASQDDAWEFKRNHKNDLHPTMKPIEVCARAIKNSSQFKNIILDLFGGSGSTLIACEQLDRRCFMMELDPVYVQIIINRWEKLTKKQAKKLN